MHFNSMNLVHTIISVQSFVGSLEDAQTNIAINELALFQPAC